MSLASDSLDDHRTSLDLVGVACLFHALRVGLGWIRHSNHWPEWSSLSAAEDRRRQDLVANRQLNDRRPPASEGAQSDGTRAAA